MAMQGTSARSAGRAAVLVPWDQQDNEVCVRPNAGWRSRAGLARVDGSGGTQGVAERLRRRRVSRASK
jgi:hypothetical protein